MDSYIKYSHEALCLLLEYKDCEIDRLTAQLAERDEECVNSDKYNCKYCSPSLLNKCKYQKRITLEQETTTLRTKLAECETAMLKLNGYYSPDRYHHDISEARKQVAREVEKHLLGMHWTIPYHETEAMIDRDEAIFWVRQRYGLEGEGWTK